MSGYDHAEQIAASAGRLVPRRTSDPAEAMRLVAEEGAAILTGMGTAAEDAESAAWTLFAGRARAVPPAAEVRAGGVIDRPVAGRVGPEERLGVHTDGFGYGDLYPDFLMLLCAQDSDVGGESFLVDGYAVLDALAATEQGRTLVERMESVPVDQTEDGMHRSVSPLVGRTPAGRRMVRRFPFQKARSDSAEPVEDAALIEAWDRLCKAAAVAAPRFKLAPGEVVIADNYRVLHGREPYQDPGRLMWRVWVWSDAARGVPSGSLASDTRYANVPATAGAGGWPTVTADATSLAPYRSSQPDNARNALHIDGAAVVTGLSSAEAAIAAARDLLDGRALRVKPQFEATRTGYLASQAKLATGGPDRWGRVRRFSPPSEVLIPHNDGYGFGDLAPDYLFLWCERPDPDAGESWLIDGAGLLRALETDEATADLAAFCWSVPIDHSEPGFIQNPPAPVARSLPGGRTQVRHNPYMVPAPGPDEATHAPLISAWAAAVTTARERAHRFRLSAGDLLCIDNYRMMHGRDPYFDERRRLVAIWGWTTEAVQVPDHDMHLV